MLRDVGSLSTISPNVHMPWGESDMGDTNLLVSLSGHFCESLLVGAPGCPSVILMSGALDSDSTVPNSVPSSARTTAHGSIAAEKPGGVRFLTGLIMVSNRASSWRLCRGK